MNENNALCVGNLKSSEHFILNPFQSSMHVLRPSDFILASVSRGNHPFHVWIGTIVYVSM